MKHFDQVRLSILLCGSLLAWGLSCLLVHGPVILAYVGIQAATSGVFALSIYRAEQRHQRTRSQTSVKRLIVSEERPAADVLHSEGIAV